MENSLDLTGTMDHADGRHFLKRVRPRVAECVESDGHCFRGVATTAGTTITHELICSELIWSG